MNFKEWLDDTPFQKLIDSLRKQYAGVVLWASEHEAKISISDIKVPKEMRDQGIGSAILAAIKQYAASVGKPIVLSPAPERGKKAALNRFYQRNGFNLNAGKNIDFGLSSSFRKTMVWRPTK
jgi:GNAT superfamily N-acetyltransferase